MGGKTHGPGSFMPMTHIGTAFIIALSSCTAQQVQWISKE
jgi:hypothetical protein